MTSSSVSSVSAMASSGMTGASPSQNLGSVETFDSFCSAAALRLTPLACAMHWVSASRTAFVVMVAPPTASTSADWRSMICAANFSPSSLPMPAVSALVSTATSVIALSLKVAVTVTSFMPLTVALYVPGM